MISLEGWLDSEKAPDIPPPAASDRSGTCLGPFAASASTSTTSSQTGARPGHSNTPAQAALVCTAPHFASAAVMPTPQPADGLEGRGR